MAKKSTAKGARFEREIVRIFRQHWGVEFERTPQSGGWGRFRTKGDLVANPEVHPDWPFYVEVKKQERWELSLQIPDLLEGWWDKSVDQAGEENRIPLLIFSKNFAPKYIRFLPEHLGFAHLDFRCRHTHLTAIDGSVIMVLRDFFSMCDHGWLINFIRK